jgi:DNA-binding CsgD family transcriptional regulator
MQSVEEFSVLIATIYDTIFDPVLWTSVLVDISGVLHAHAASIHVFNPVAGRTSLHFDYNSDPYYLELANTRYATMNPVGAAVLLGKVDQPMGLFDLISEEELVGTRWHREWMVPQRYHDMLGVILARKPHEVSALSTVRLLDQPRFSPEDRQFLARIAPHARRAVTITGLLEQQAVERSTFAEVMDQLSTAILLVDRTGRVVRANAAAEDMLARPGAVNMRGAMLEFRPAIANSALRTALAQISPEPRFIPLRSQNGATITAAILPVEVVGDLFAVFVRTEEAELPSMPQILRDIFGLTPRELAVLLPLLEGRELDEIATLLGIAQTTAKSHLSQLFAKTDTTRQADLIQRVLKAMPPVRA